MFRAAVALLLVVFASTALAQQPKRRPKPAVLAGPSVCVASAIGHTFHVQKVGIMVFGNALDTVPIDSWGIDDFVVRRIGAMLGKRFTVRQVKLPPALLAAYEKPGGLFRDPDKELREAVRAAAAGAERCTLYIVVTRAFSPYGNTNQSLTGLGILKHEGIISRHLMFAIFVIRVYDGNTFARLKAETARTETILESAFGWGVRGMHRTVDETWWPATPQAAVQSAKLRDGIRALVDQGLAATLPGML